MLVLTRYEGESIIIDGRITVTVERINERRVKLSIQAPREVQVHRAEVQRRNEERRGE